MVRARRTTGPKVDPTAPTQSEIDFYLEMRELRNICDDPRRDAIEGLRASWRTLTRDEKLAVMEYDHEREESTKADRKERLLLGLIEPKSEKERGSIRLDRIGRLGRSRRLEMEGPLPTDRKSIDAGIAKALAEKETAKEKAERVEAKKKAKERRARFLQIIDEEIILFDPAEPALEPEPVTADESAVEAFVRPVVELVPRDPDSPRKPRRRPGLSGVSIPYDN